MPCRFVKFVTAEAMALFALLWGQQYNPMCKEIHTYSPALKTAFVADAQSADGIFDL